MHNVPKGTIDINEVIGYLASDRYLSKREAAAYLGVSVRTLETQRDVPRFRFGRNGTKILFKKSELDQWMKKCRVIDDGPDIDRIVREVLEGVSSGRTSN
jgi:excisionase family DNA binding protein